MKTERNKMNPPKKAKGVRAKIRVKRYETLEAVLGRYWGFPIDKGYLESKIAVKHIGSGKSAGFLSGRDEVESLKSQGYWGFADQRTRVVHFWANKSADPYGFIYFLGHEVGHLTGKAHKTMHLEEQRANLHGSSAKTAYQIFRQVFAPKKPKSEKVSPPKKVTPSKA